MYKGGHDCRQGVSPPFVINSKFLILFIMASRKILKNFLSLSSGEAIGKLLAFVRVIFLARILGTELFGTLEFASAILLYFVLFADLGLGLLGTREIARDISKVKIYVSNIITIKLLFSFFAYFLIAVIAYFVPKSLETKKAVLIYGLILFPASLSTVWVFLGLEKMKIVAIATVIFHLFFTVFVVLLVRDGKHVLYVPFIQLMCDIIISAFLMVLFVRRFGSIRLQFNFPLWKKLFADTLPIWFAQLLGTINFNLDIIMIGVLMEEKFIGWYGASYKFIIFLVGFITAYQYALFPVISKLHKSNIVEVKSLIGRSIKFCAAFSIPIGFGGMILARPIINMVYGGQYTNSVLPFQVLAWTIPLIILRSTYRNTLIGLSKQVADLKLIGCGAIVNIVLNLILIPNYGITGAAIATVCSEAVILCLGYYYVRNMVVQIPILKYLVKPAISGVLMSLCLIFLYKQNIFLTLIVGICVYFMALVLTKGITLTDIQIYRKGA